ncbi:MAG: hypothetical protein GY757_47740, partial [bacterium]|nr:hypothetical protein [bacterium]
MLEEHTGTGFSYIDDYAHDHFSKKHKLLIIPSGELMGDENSEIIKQALKQFVEAGNSILVLSQQFGSHYDKLMPVPEGESLHSYGFREDQSCLKNSVYFDNMHPVFSSSTTQITDAGLDGYASDYPAGSTVLLRRRANRQAALLYYPLGESSGYVIHTGLFTDFARARSQATLSELRIFRDTVTFFRNPRLPVPMFNLQENPTPAISLNVTIKNNTENPAAKAILTVFDPDRKRELYREEQGINLTPGEEVEIPLQFTLPEITDAELGICHVDYILLDAASNPLQLPMECTNGRFAVYRLKEDFSLERRYDTWITVKDETVYWNEAAEFTIHFKNGTETQKVFEPAYSWNHNSKKVRLDPVTVPAGEEVKILLPVNAPVNPGTIGSIGKRFRIHRKNDIGRYIEVGSKGIQVITARVKNIVLRVIPG